MSAAAPVTRARRLDSPLRRFGRALGGARPRWLELALLAFPVLLLATGLTTIALAGGNEPTQVDRGLVGAMAVALLVAHLWLTVRYPRADQVLLPTAAMVAALSIIMVARLQPDLAVRQATWVGIGTVAMLGTLMMLPRVGWLRQYRYTWAALGLLLVLSTFLFGVDPNGSGARLWLGFGGVYFQPSEILKVLLVVFLAAYLDDYRELLTLSRLRLGPLSLPPLPYLTPLLLMLAIALGSVVLQRDLGAALLLYGVFLSMLFVASGRLSYVLGGALTFVAGASILYQLFSVVKVRVDTWLDPWATATTTGYQLVQGLTALAAGGLLGTGLTYGYPGYVPAVHTDFMIAAIGEEMGLAGTLGVIGLYVVLVHRGLRIAMLSRDSFAGLLAAGLTSVLAIQALVILGGTLKLIPLTGVTLPLLSYGGSSVLANFVLLGLLLAVSGEPQRPAHAA
ncbi:MAG: FtsW/RodA/SpoVE family cell cycle protein [Chloroflexota bacterium]